MKLYKSSLLIITLFFLIGCGGGGTNSNNNSAPTNTDNISISTVPYTILYNRTPEINEELTLSLLENTSSPENNFSWEIVSQPTSSDIQLNTSPDKKTVTLIPKMIGQYKFSVTPTNGITLETQFSISKKFTVNETKIEGYDPTKLLSEQLGIVSNQAWVFSESLTEAELRPIIEINSNFTVLGFDQVRGLLVEFVENSQSENTIQLLKSINGVDSVYPRVYRGKNFRHQTTNTPDDGSSFNDGGDNWYLEDIGITKAWDISTGSTEFNIGISDNGYYPEHEELKGRFKEVLIDYKEKHGTSTSGSVGGISNNKKGVSGINWNNSMIAGDLGLEGLYNLVMNKEVRLTNSSWSLIPYGLSKAFDPDDPLSVSTFKRRALEQTRDFRILATEFPSNLFVYSAGNGINRAKGNSNGVYGVDGRFASPALHYKELGGLEGLFKLSNVIFVSAYGKDHRLPYYANYGESIDIAAPTSYKSAKEGINIYDVASDEEYGTNSLAAFAGTSAAAPLVTGVASLILAVEPSLFPSEIKTILIKSATDFVSERYITPNADENGNFDTETLDTPIPRLNAASALEMTKDISDARKITVIHSFSDPFKSTVSINVSNENSDIAIQSFDYEVGVRNNGSLEELISGTNAGFSPLVFQNLDPTKTNYIVSGTTNTPAHQPTEISLNSNFSYEFLIPKVNALTSNKNTQVRIPNVSIEIKSEDGFFDASMGASDTNGSARLYLKPGKYNILAKAEGYKDLTRTFTLREIDSELDVILELEPESIPNPPPSAFERITPITPLTSSQSVTNTSGPVTIIYESGFDGDIEAISNPVESGPTAFYDQSIQFKAEITSMTINQVERETGVDVSCQNGDNSYSTKIANFETGVVFDTGTRNGQLLSCTSIYESPLPAIVGNGEKELEGFLADWATDRPQGNALSTNCPVNDDVIGAGGCTINLLTNYLITDDSGKQHKVSTRLIYDTL